LSWFAEYLMDMRRFDEARDLVHRAQQAEPRWLEPMVVSGNIHAFTGHLDLAIDEYRRALAIEPTFGLGNHFLGRAYLAKGLHTEAVAQLKKSNELLGEVPFSRGDLGYALAVSGDRAAAERMIGEMRRQREETFFPAFPIALVHVGLSQKDAALEWLDRAVAERHTGYYLPSADPLYDRLRSDERFRTMMQRMRLPH
jgi:tetratricopeptide (TPR) repeat protein